MVTEEQMMVNVVYSQAWSSHHLHEDHEPSPTYDQRGSFHFFGSGGNSLCDTPLVMFFNRMFQIIQNVVKVFRLGKDGWMLD